MIKNYFRVAWRNLTRSRFFATLNIAGLAFGMAVSMFLLCWVLDEYSFDKFHKKGKDIYLLAVNADWGGVRTLTTTPVVLGEDLSHAFPEVTANVQVRESYDNLLYRTGTNKVKGKHVIYATGNLFTEFDFPLVSGDKRTVLSQPNAIVISEAVAGRYFAKEDPIGKMITLEDGRSLQITGVAKDAPVNSSIRFDYVLPMALTIQADPWLLKPGSYSISNYMVLKPGADAAQLTEKMQQYYRSKNKDNTNQLWLQPFEDTYLYGKYDNGKVSGGRIEYVRLFLITALIVLAIACINFMNLSTAQASKRAREVGVRKSMGATRISLVLQFTGEAILMCVIAAISAAVVVWLLMPVFNNFTGKHITFTLPVAGQYLLLLLLVIVVTGLMAGSYPAFVLSRFLPVKVLKGDVSTGGGATLFRKNLVVLQFVLSFIFIVSSLVIYNQMRYIYHRNIGVARENILYVPLEESFLGKQKVIEQSLSQLPQVKSFTYSSSLPITIGGTSADLSWEGKPEKLVLGTAPLQVGYDYPATMGMSMKEGRFFSKDFPTDSGAYVINETAARIMNMTNPVGRKISFWNGDGKIIGVVKDFHFSSLHENIKPLVMMLTPVNSFLMVRLAKGDVTSQVASIEKIFDMMNPGYPVEYHFMDEAFDSMYQSETMLQKLARVFAIVAVLISCLGLFGLSVFTAEQRKKEIGIRKVLGASVISVTTLLSREFLLLVLLGILVAAPISWYLMNNWLSGFAYHADLSAWIFIAAGVMAVLIAMATVSYQSVKAALANPVHSLKAE
ncbi:ABC transporter permease [Chitinophaga sp. Ak27]|uniref:ABC transporter permease n=1 Tax=Chitinophaga sp. Ak27 TaxID=2726116 RepID=UPI00145C9080|nr:ABC transporter permease [Chitinophaga sp. Ak27]NLU94290.1 FtsX-like permease family protein [Chitinophaga sp. Ak27]